MIVVLTPNPAVDVTYRVAEQRVGETQRVLDVARRPGGKGLNVARVLESAGVRTRSVLPLGGAPGSWIADAARELGLEVTPIPVTGTTRTTVTVVDDAHHPTMFGEPGPVVSAAEWQALGAVLSEAVTGADGFVLSGSFPRDADPALAGTWVRTARAAGALTVADVSGPALLEAARAGVDLCKPNREELLEATGATDEGEGAAVLLGLGAGTVVVSRGAAGIAAYPAVAAGSPVVVEAVPGVTGNPTGAGDAATAGLVSALVAGHPLATALRWAAAYGAAAVLTPTAGEVDQAAVGRFLTGAGGPAPTGGPAPIGEPAPTSEPAAPSATPGQALDHDHAVTPTPALDLPGSPA